jgi:hypothetical protein
VVAETAWQIERHLDPHAEGAFLCLVALGRLRVVDVDVEAVTLLP